MDLFEKMRKRELDKLEKEVPRYSRSGQREIAITIRPDMHFTPDTEQEQEESKNRVKELKEKIRRKYLLED